MCVILFFFFVSVLVVVGCFLLDNLNPPLANVAGLVVDIDAAWKKILFTVLLFLDVCFFQKKHVCRWVLFEGFLGWFFLFQRCVFLLNKIFALAPYYVYQWPSQGDLF